MNGWPDTQVDFVHRVDVPMIEDKKPRMTARDRLAMVAVAVASCGIAIAALVHAVAWFANKVLA